MLFNCRWLLVAVLFAIVSYSQSATTGALTGAVSDSAGAALPHVTVTLANLATMATQTVVTGANGAYSFSMLPSGAYEVQFAAAGFKTARMSSVAVNVGEAPTLDAAMERGETAEPVPCQCRITVTTSSTSTSVNSKTITAVPLTTRNFTQILSMASGSAADVNNAGTLGRGTRSVNVNGNTSAGSYTLDGAVAPSAVPNPDTISELKIQTSQYDAVYGAQVPSTALITKSGEHEFHGDAWEFVRNDVFNANSFFRNATGQSKPNLKQHQFGATLGGPVRGRKLFFFGSYQGTRQINGLDTTSTSNPILPPLTNDRSAAALAAQFCPANHPLDRRYLTFAGGKQLDCGNQTTATTAPINPVALGILQLKTAGGGWLVPVPQTLLASGSNAGPRLLVIQPALHLQRESVPGEWRLSGHSQTDAGRTRLPGDDRSVPHLRLSTGLSRHADGSGAGDAAGAGGARLCGEPQPHVSLPQDAGERSAHEFHAVDAECARRWHSGGDGARDDAGRPILRSAARDEHTGSAGQLPALRHAGKRFRHGEQILLLERQSRLDARQPQNTRRGLFPGAEQRTRRPGGGARQTGLPDVQRFSDGAQRRRQSESIGPE